MAYLEVKNIRILGVVASLPRDTVENKDYDVIPEKDRDEFIESIGVERRRRVTGDIRTSDLCAAAAEDLLKGIGWSKDEIDLLIFVSQTPDYRMPATSCVLQHKLGLSKTCMTVDISQGCSGYVYGLGVAGNLVSTGNIRKCLLLVGNTQSLNINYRDRSTYPLFSDAGSATAIEYCPGSESDSFMLSFGTDGSGEKTIIIPDGGYRNMVSPESFVEHEYPGGIIRNNMNLSMQGDDVFAFVIGNIPKFTKEMMSHFCIEKDSIDYFLLHHASKFLCKKLIKKLQLPEEKTPLILKDFGNASNATIPLLVSTVLRDDILARRLRIYATGFGVGLSLGVGIIDTGRLSYVNVIEM